MSKPKPYVVHSVNGRRGLLARDLQIGDTAYSRRTGNPIYSISSLEKCQIGLEIGLLVEIEYADGTRNLRAWPLDKQTPCERPTKEST